MKRPGSALLIVALCCTATPRTVISQDTAQAGPAQPQGSQTTELPVFRAQSNLVVLHVNVFDRRSDAVPNLPQSAFSVTEDGTPQDITLFGSADVPVAVGLVIDNSSSMMTRHAMVAAGTKAFAESSHPADEAFTIIFNENIRHGLPDNVPFTQNRILLESTLRRFRTGGMTALHDAVVEGIEHLEEASHQKHVLVVLSDGEDNASRHSEANMIERAARSNTLIYTVSTEQIVSGVGNRGLLRKLAEVSGGLAYFPKSEADVVAALKEIAENIRRGYSIGYVPTNTVSDGRYRRVKVAVRLPGGNNLKVNARDGYLAPRHIDAQ